MGTRGRAPKPGCGSEPFCRVLFSEAKEAQRPLVDTRILSTRLFQGGRAEREAADGDLSAMSALALEELSAIAAIYCGQGECEVLHVSGDGFALQALRGAGFLAVSSASGVSREASGNNDRQARLPRGGFFGFCPRTIRVDKAAYETKSSICAAVNSRLKSSAVVWPC